MACDSCGASALPINLTLIKERLIRTLDGEEEQRMLRSALLMSQMENICYDDNQKLISSQDKSLIQNLDFTKLMNPFVSFPQVKAVSSEMLSVFTAAGAAG